MPKLKLLSLVLLIAVLVSGCSITFETSDSAKGRTDGGVYKSADSGRSWKQSSTVPTASGAVASFNVSSVVSIEIDPQDKLAIYAGTDNGGLLYSYDGAASWSVARDLGKRYIKDIQVSPLNKCVIFVATQNKVYKSGDCSRTWEDAYYDNDPSAMVRSLAIDPKNDRIVYAGTSRGEIIRSADGGNSWTTIKRFTEMEKLNSQAMDITKIVINEKNSNNIWIATKANGIYKTLDRGASWQSFKEEFMEINTKSALTISDFYFHQADGATVIAATKAGLIRTIDGGGHWHSMDLVPPADKTAINVVSLHPKDSDRIYYATNTTFGSSIDGGENWTSKKLPSTRAGAAIAVDPELPNVVYLGVLSLVTN